MSLKSSWLFRCAVALLTAQLASACGGGGGGGDPDPTPGKDTAAPTTKATPTGGSFNSLVAVALVCEDGAGSGCAATYYTLDGSTPGTGSTQYREPFTLSTTTTLRFFSVDKAGNAEAVKTEQYTFPGAGDTQPPTTTASPASGAYNSPRSVALTCADGAGTGCAATYYTVDGSVPTETSSRYTAPLAIAASTTLRFFSVDKAGNVEGTRTERYVLDTAAPTVSASPRTGTYGGAVDVTLACDDGNGAGCASIHYTLDGSIPSEASPTYSAAIHVTATTRLRFLAVDRAGNASEPGSEVYTLDATGPVSSAAPKGGTFRAAFLVTLTCDDGTGTGCAATYYTLDGSTPTRASTRYTGAITVSGNTTLRFFSVDAAGNDGPVVTETYVVDSAAPVTRAVPPGRSYGGEQFVTLECEDTAGTGCAATYYTLDGSTPTTASPLYVSPVRVASSLTLRFFSVDVAGNPEAVKAEPYLIDTVAPTASASVASGTYGAAQRVTLTCDDGTGSGCAAIHYTLDGSQPTTSSAVYSAQLQLSANTTLRFFAVDAVGNQGAVQSRTYVIDVNAPLTTASPNGGAFNADTQVTLSCDDGQGGTGCGVTRYTLDGSVPNDTSTQYSGPITVTASATLRFVSVDAVGNRESVRMATFTIDKVAPTVSASPRGGPYFTQQTVTLTCSDSGSGCASIHYTTNGTTPTPASTRYTAPLGVSTNTPLRFIAVDAAGNSSAVVLETYTFTSDTTAPVTTASPAGRVSTTAIPVTLSCVDTGGSGCNGTYYTLDGSEPSTSSTRYTGTFTLSSSAQLRFFSVDVAGNLEAAKSETYTIDGTPPVTQAAPGGGSFSEPVTVTLSCVDTGTSCTETRYTTDGTTPGTTSPLYTAPLSFTRTTTLRFSSVDAAGNREATKTQTYTLLATPRNASAQIAEVRAAAVGPVSLSIEGALVTYVKPLVGSATNDPAGLFLQAEQAGPAIFVEVDPSTLSPVPQGGERVRVTVSERLTVNGQARARISSYSALSTGNSLDGFAQDVSSVDLPPAVDTYESEYISISGTIGAAGFTAGGSGHVQAPFVTAGVPEGSASAANLRLRMVETVRDALDVGPLCSVTVFSPLWRFGTIAQPSVWTASQVSAFTCPAPKVTSAYSSSSNSAVVRFDRRIDPASVLSNGSQFSIPGLTVTSAVANNRDVWLTTELQTARQSYTVTAATTLKDTHGQPLDASARTATFTGFVQPASLRISEFAPNVPLGRDLVELYVLQGGSVQGATLVDANTTLATLPDVQVATGDLIVVHLNPDRVNGTDAPSSETSGKSEYPQWTYSSNYDTAWDFQGGTTGIGTGNRTLRIRDGYGVTQDAIGVVSPGNTFTGYPAQLQALQAEGQWLPYDCGGALCTYTTFPSAWDVSVDWSTSSGKSTTVSRVLFGDSDTRNDWSVVSATLGAVNP